jgi:hypothetical protein
MNNFDSLEIATIRSSLAIAAGQMISDGAFASAAAAL